jgi:hypothetical protein
MCITPSNTFHINRAYNLPGTMPTKPSASTSAAQASPAQAIAFQAGAAPKTPSTLTRLIAATIPGGVDFSGDEPQPSAPALPLYKHPADRNAVETTLHSGRLIDTNG